MLMVSCQVSIVPNRKNDGAQSTTIITHTTKNHACEVRALTYVAKRSKTESFVDTSDGNITSAVSDEFSLVAFSFPPFI